MLSGSYIGWDFRCGEKSLMRRELIRDSHCEFMGSLTFSGQSGPCPIGLSAGRFPRAGANHCITPFEDRH